ncbi:pyruvate, phosphate dikinase [Vagococcus penaei]|uniref:Pyruvate, phosphate dikinase n=1 Tax=Vagococcus penaei TaxID=633807 RepID=A0A1Q2D733_9ENTE|nr:pyruvate, phosphate dikinase [Vagococcus penaei]AQP54236.1 pyruvate, phosphate dikinase [Vagococcus penaei]RST98239.1 pyruvate, phosphate dikinase [Vagococcus penaei]
MKQVYQFHEGQGSMRQLLGGKGANLAEMTRLGLPVPPGFTITTEACIHYLANGKRLTTELKNEIEGHLSELEKQTGKSINDTSDLLLLSVRSGSKFSMPGMMDTILNLGLNDKNVEVFAELTGNPQFAYDCYRRLLQMYGNVVCGIEGYFFEGVLETVKNKYGVKQDYDLTVEQLKEIIAAFKQVYLDHDKQEFPQDVREQMYQSIEAVFSSWNNNRARVYRELHGIDHNLGTAVNIQAMVFGNSGDQSGTGVLFTRNPATGEHKLFGEYLINAQGEDVVAGVRTPLDISHLEKEMPEVYADLFKMATNLEKHYKDMQDIEFTIDNKKLYLLQTRNGKRTAQAAVKIAVDMVEEGLVTKDEALMMIEPESINSLLHPVFDSTQIKEDQILSTNGLPASPGSATGKICFDTEAAKVMTSQGHAVVLVRQETSPEDIEGMVISKAIVTSRGGMTSHAAVVARGMGTCCVAGCSDLEVNEELKQVRCGDTVLTEGDILSVDGSKGHLYVGEIPLIISENNDYLDTILDWAQERARLAIRMNAETVTDIQAGLDFNAAGIGLVRTEHMFFAPARLKEMRRFILSRNTEERQKALDIILNYQLDDFKEIFDTIAEKPAVIRLLDPPLHEFVPTKLSEIEKLAVELELDSNVLTSRINELHEVNPMLGHRGCRLAVTYPELYLMQAEAIIRSAIERQKTTGLRVSPEIMIPLVGMTPEVTILKEKIVAHINQIIDAEAVEIDYTVGTMIEIPRACLIADEIAEEADFFSFGTNDLTQMTFGFSRDDAGKFIQQYEEQGILPKDPFQTLDVEGVGELIKVAVERARSVRPDLKIGVCGELGGDPASIKYFDKWGLDYVSCSPFRIPIAYLAAAQSQIEQS